MEHQIEAEDKLRSLKLKEGATADEMDDHYRAFNNVYLEASHSGATLFQDLRVQLFLESLPHDFKVARQIFLDRPQDQQTWSELYRRYQIEATDRRLHGVTSAPEINAMQLKKAGGKAGWKIGGVKKGNNKQKCWYCGKGPHHQRDCRIRIADGAEMVKEPRNSGTAKDKRSKDEGGYAGMIEAAEK
jgi:hypothetical protein